MVVPSTSQLLIARRLPKLKRQMGIMGAIEPEDIVGIAEKLNARPADVVIVDQRNRMLDQALDAPLTAEAPNSLTLLDIFADETLETEEGILDRISLERRKTAFIAALDVLNERERRIITDRLLRDPPLKLEELGQIYSVTRERIRQLEKRSLERVLKAMEEITGHTLIMPGAEALSAAL